jgi:hypothetical protein
MNLARRVILSLALAAAIGVAAATVNGLLVDGPAGGWMVFDPNSDVTINALAPSGTSDGDLLRAALIWFVAIAVWLSISWRLFRSSDE